MAAVYPDAIITEYHDGTSWVDISQYVVDDIKGNSGFTTSKPDDRVAGLGVLELELNNAGRQFTVYGGDMIRGLPTLPGWKKGAPVRTSVQIGSRNIPYWVGRLADSKSDDDLVGDQRAHVVCVDWFDVATRFPMRGTQILLNQTVDQAAQAILARLSVQPSGTRFDVGNELLPAVFSNVREKTKAISELNKLMMSELGFAYLLRDGTLRIENSSTRPGTRTLDMVPLHPSLWDTLQLADGDTFALADGDSLLLEEAEEAQLALSAEKMDIEEKDEVINAAYVKAYPVRTDTTLVVVAKLGSALKIPEKTSVPFSIRYTDPNGGNPISATNLQAPVVTTDYLFNTKEDGTGTNISAFLTVTPTYYGDQVDYILTSSYAGEGYVIKLQARGFGIYFDSPISIYISDEDSIEQDGDTAIEIDQKYKRNFYTGQAFARSVVEEHKLSKSRVKRARFLANLNHQHLMACSYLDIGSLLKVYDNRSEMYKWYYITGRSFVITLGKIIHMTFALVESISILSSALIPISVDFGNSTWRLIDYGYCPRVAGLPKRSISVKVTPRTISGRLIYTISDVVGGGFSFALGGTNQLQWYLKGLTSLGAWNTPNNSITPNVEHTLILTHDRSVDPNADPIIYIDGVAAVLTEVSTPSETGIHSEEGLHLFIGSAVSDGPIEDVRVYDRILSQAEVNEITANDPYADVVTDGLVFQGNCLNADHGTASLIPQYANVMDNIFRMVGKPDVIPTFAERSLTLQTTPTNQYFGVDYSPTLHLFGACGDRLMTSPDGVTWTNRATPTGALNAICWSPGLGMFAAVGFNSIYTSTDGIIWTSRTPPNLNDYQDICWSPALNLFVAVAVSGAGNRVMTSPDGINWTARTSAADNEWVGVTWSPSLGLLVAVSSSGSANRVMTSPDGITWTARTTTDRLWHSVVWSTKQAKFVAIAPNYSMVSTDGINWSETNHGKSQDWRGMAYSPQLDVYMTVADAGTNRVMYSPNGVSWSTLTPPADNTWYGICWSDDLALFVIVGFSGANRVMTF